MTEHFKHMIGTTEFRRCAQCVLHPWNFFGAYATVNWDMYANMYEQIESS
jgi:hypothetical protein